jgi:hypothetical protein
MSGVLTTTSSLVFFEKTEKVAKSMDETGYAMP